MKRQNRIAGIRAALVVACALLVSLGQPLAALTALGACASCEHDVLEPTCCCTPEEGTAAAVEEGCCSEPGEDAADAELSAAHECCCNSVPEGPAIPVQLPPVQDITCASAASRAIAMASSVSMRTVLGFEGPAKTPAIPGGVSPPGSSSANETRLGRAAVRGISTLLALLSVARL